MKIKLDAKFEKVAFKFTPIKTTFEASMLLTLSGSARIRLQYGKDPLKGFYLEQYFIFSGIQGEFKGSASVKVNNFFTIGTSENEEKPIPFNLINPYEKEMFRIHFF